MTDIPIIFSGPMVLGIFEGRKTKTRRLAWHDNKKNGEYYVEKARPTPWQRVRPGDRLWVRENLRKLQMGWAYSAGEGLGRAIEMPPSDPRVPSMVAWAHHKEQDYCPSIHMPRWASRLTLFVTAVKIERVKSISEEDAKAEGVIQDDGSEPDIWYIPGSGGTPWGKKMDPFTADRPSKVFCGLWRALHGRESWDENPEVVALTFTVQRQNIDAIKKAA